MLLIPYRSFCFLLCYIYHHRLASLLLSKTPLYSPPTVSTVSYLALSSTLTLFHSHSTMSGVKKSDIQFLLNPSSQSNAYRVTSDRPYQCRECGRAFRERGNMNKHVLSVHRKEKSHQCTLCHKSFAFRDGLLRHISTVHENERRHKCDLCNRQFKQLSHLVKHRRSIHKTA